MKLRTLVLTLTTFAVMTPTMWLANPNKALGLLSCSVVATRTNGDVRLSCRGPYFTNNNTNIVIPNSAGRERLCVVTARRTNGDVALRCL